MVGWSAWAGTHGKGTWRRVPPSLEGDHHVTEWNWVECGKPWTLRNTPSPGLKPRGGFQRLRLMPPTPYLPLEIWSLKSEICRLKFEIWCLNIEMWNLKSEFCQLNSEIWSLKLDAINFSFQFEIRKLKFEIGDSMFVIRHVKFEVQRRNWNLMLEATPPSQIRDLIFCLLLPPPSPCLFCIFPPKIH